MAKKLTEGQRLARKLVAEAAKRVIAEMDEMEFRRGCTTFDVHFHLSCWRYDQSTYLGRPVASGMPVYIGLHGKTA